MKTFKYRIYPTRKQISLLKRAIEDSRLVYNAILEQKIAAYEKDKSNLTQYEAQNLIPKIKNKNKLASATIILRFAKDRLFDAYNNFFKKHNSFPRFKSEDRYRSIGLYKGQYRLDGQKIAIPKVGSIRIVLHRKYEGDPKQIVIKVSPTGKWYLSVFCDNVPKKRIKKTGKQVGIDLGLETFATMSDGNTIERERFFKEEKERLAKEQQILSRKKKNGLERTKAKKVIARVHERIGFKRDNFIHQNTKRLLDKYDGIVVEDLNIQQLQQKKGKFQKSQNRSIQDVAWRQFITILSQKAEGAIGKKVVMVSPVLTSQICSACGYVRGKEKRLILSDRTFVCPSCGVSMGRDLNAAKNIYRSGAALL